MSNLLRADTDQMRTTVQALQQGSQALQENYERARQAMSAMQNSPWSGQNRVMAEDYWQAIEARFAPSFETIEDIAQRLLRTAEAYDAAARVFGEGSSVVGGSTAGEVASDGEYIDKRNLGLYEKAILEALKISPDILLLNSHGNALIEAIGHSKFLPLLGFGLDVYQDITAGEYEGDIAKILGVNGVNTAITAAIGMSGIGGAVLLTNGLIQIGGNLRLGVQETVAGLIATDQEMHDLLRADVTRSKDALDRMDVGNITKEFSETIYDVYAQPYVDVGKATFESIQDISRDPSYENIMQTTQALNRVLQENAPEMIANSLCPASGLLRTEGREGLIDTGKAAVNVLDGAVDFVVSDISSSFNQRFASTAKIVDTLPVSDSFKDSVNETAKSIIKQNQNIADGVVNFFKI